MSSKPAGPVPDPGAELPAQLAAAAGAEGVPDELVSEPEPDDDDPDELDPELSDFADSLAVDEPLRLSVR